MNKLFFIVSIFWSCASFAQPKWHLGFSGGADASYRMRVYEENAMEINLPEGFKISPNINLIAQRKITNRISFQTGVQFMQMGMRSIIDFSSPSFPNEIDPFYGFVRPVSPNTGIDKIIFVQQYNYISIPLMLNYHGKGKKFKMIFGAGISPAYMLSANRARITKGEETTREVSPQKDVDFNWFNLFATAQVGVEYRLNQNWKLRATPNANFGLLKITNTPTSDLLWNAGLQLGLFYGI
jgi:hypothetical protein